MSSKPQKRGYSRRIEPANLADLPTVLDTAQVADVLRISVERVREYTNAGKLRRLDYSTDFLYYAGEVERFLEAYTASLPKTERREGAPD